MFAAPFTLEAAEAVAADDDLDALEVLDLLARLVDKSLVQEAGEPVSASLETLRHHALGPSGGARASWRAARPAPGVVRAAGPPRRRLDRELARFPVLDEVAAEAPDLLAALGWSLETDGRPAVDATLRPLGSRLGLPPRSRRELGAAMARGCLDDSETGSPAWLRRWRRSPPSCTSRVSSAGWPAARQALDAHRAAGRLRSCGRHRAGRRSGPGVARQADWATMQERVAEIGRQAGNRQLELVPLLALASTLADRGARARVRPLISRLDRLVPPGRLDALPARRREGALVAAFDGDFVPARQLVEPVPERGAAEKVPCFLAGMIALWTRRPCACSPMPSPSQSGPCYREGAFATALQWLRAVEPLIDDDLDAARRLLPTRRHG